MLKRLLCHESALLGASLCVLIFISNLSFLSCDLPPDSEAFTDGEDDGVTEAFNYTLNSNVTEEATIDALLEERTALPRDIINDILNLDVGIYTTQRFDYYNMQHTIRTGREPSAPVYRCYDDLLRCLTSQSINERICGWSDDIYYHDNWVELDSYCHLYFDNCRRQYRYWVVYKKGPCEWSNKTGSYYINYYSISG